MRSVTALAMLCLPMLYALPGWAGEGALAGLRGGCGTAAYSYGNAYTALAFDPTALVYNPAGPAQIKTWYFTAGSVTHGAGSFSAASQLDFKCPYAALSLTTRRAGTFSALWRHFGVGDIEARSSRDDVNASTFGYSENLITVGWSYAVIPDQFYFGVGLNHARMGFDLSGGSNAAAWGASVGVLYSGLSPLRLGASVESAMTLTHDDDREDHSPGRGRGGMALGPLGRVLTLALDVEQVNGEPVRLHAGTRASYQPSNEGPLRRLYIGGGISSRAVEDRGSGYRIEHEGRLSLGAGATVSLGQSALEAGYALVSGRFGLDHFLSLSIYSGQ